MQEKFRIGDYVMVKQDLENCSIKQGACGWIRAIAGTGDEARTLHVDWDKRSPARTALVGEMPVGSVSFEFLERCPLGSEHFEIALMFSAVKELRLCTEKATDVCNRIASIAFASDNKDVEKLARDVIETLDYLPEKLDDGLHVRLKQLLQGG